MPAAVPGSPPRYIEACRLAGEGKYEEARRVYAKLSRGAARKDPRLWGLIQNDLAVLDALEGKFDEAREGWRRAIGADGGLLLARLNRDLMEAEISLAGVQEEVGELELVPAPGSFQLAVSSCRLADGSFLALPTSALQPSTVEGVRTPGSQPPIEGSGPRARTRSIVGDGRHHAERDDYLGSARVSDPAVRLTGGLHDRHVRSSDDPIRIAVLSLLFNWPSTGGGNMHTAGLVEFLKRAGYEVRHYFARYPAWGIGRVDVGQAFQPDVSLTSASSVEPERLTCARDVSLERLTYNEPVSAASLREALEFDEAGWNVASIQARYRCAVDEFQPDYVAITDTWNMKPLLAEAMRGYPVLLLFQAQECLCPLNNLRLLGVGPGQVEQCPRNQLATPQVCHGCLAQRGRHSGALHQAERALAGVGTAEYDQKMRRSLLEAEAVLALNPLTAGMLEPYARRVCVVPWGIDAGRFSWAADGEACAGRPAVAPEGGDPSGVGRPAPNGKRPASLIMAAVAGEFIKGFHIAHEACRLLRQTRSDFELVVTFDPPGRIDEFTRSVGWCSQRELPRHYRAADICLVPTIAQDGLSITSVEAMAAGIPVIASRIGGVPYTVSDGVTGLLCEPGDPVDLAAKIARLLDDPDLRHEMGLAGRRRFEADFTWETVIERYWRPLLTARRAAASST